MHTRIHAYMHTCTHTCIHAYMHTCIHAYMHTCIHAYMLQQQQHAHLHRCAHAHATWYTYISRLAGDIAAAYIQPKTLFSIFVVVVLRRTHWASTMLDICLQRWTAASRTSGRQSVARAGIETQASPSRHVFSIGCRIGNVVYHALYAVLGWCDCLGQGSVFPGLCHWIKVFHRAF
jgi:hypothetical protein